MKFWKKKYLRSGNLSGSARDRVSESLSHDFHVSLPLAVAFLADNVNEMLDPVRQVLFVFDFGEFVKNIAVDNTWKIIKVKSQNFWNEKFENDFKKNRPKFIFLQMRLPAWILQEATSRTSRRRRSSSVT